LTWFSSRQYTSNLSVPGLAHLIADELYRPVRDKTGINAIFTLAQSPYDRSAGEITAEVHDQIGLKLVPATESMEVLVIDHAEQP
jgi:uncharacterized protein (TIGR03435 family)